MFKSNIQRRDTDTQARINKEVDDIVSLFMFADENKLCNHLPRYVSSSPDGACRN